jgi:hypothetical protein
MFKLRMSVLAAVGSLALCTGLAGSAMAAAGGDSNSGDVWLDNVGQPAGPGHEMDPHLACQDINLWGAGLADRSGTFTVNGWPPSGSRETDYSGAWSYDTAEGGDQVVATISIANLIATAQANGDHAAHNGYHFKLDFAQDPQKHKTFWVGCPASYHPTVTRAPSGSRSTRHATRSTRHTTRETRRRRHHRRHHHRRLRQSRRISRRPRATRRAQGFTG